MTDFKSGDDVDGSPIELLARQAEELVLSSEPQQMIRHISKKAVALNTSQAPSRERGYAGKPVQQGRDNPVRDQR